MNPVPRLVFEVREIELGFEVNWRVVFSSTIDVQSCRSKRGDLWVGEDPFSKHISFGFFFLHQPETRHFISTTLKGGG